MNEKDLTTIEQLQSFLNGTQRVAFVIPGNKAERYRFIQSVLIRFDYLKLKKPDKGIVMRYLVKITGYSRQQLTRLVKQYRQHGRITASQRTVAGFARKYTNADIVLLAHMDERHHTPCGPALKKLMERAYHVFGQAEYARLAQLSVSHLYNLRQSKPYQRTRKTVHKTKPRTVNIGKRRKPQPNDQPGYIRIDTVHQGDWDKTKGLYHINTVDEVTQYELVASVEKISEHFLLPVLKQLLAEFPFIIVNFHSDNGSEYINRTVARLLNKLLVEQTKSRARKTNDNALVESKNGAVIRKHFGYDHIPSQWAKAFNQFNSTYLNPYLNYHRPCLFPVVQTDKKGKQRKTYPYQNIMTPYDKLKSIDNAEQFLKPNVTFEQLDKIAMALTDNQAADQLKSAKRKLFNAVFEQRRRLSK